MFILRNEFPSPTFSSFEVGPFTLHMYALLILTGIVAAFLLGAYRFKSWGGDTNLLLDVVLWAVPIGILGGRLFHVITHPGDYFGVYPDIFQTLYHVFAVWEGGLAIYGALVAGVFGVWFGARMSKLRFVSVLDALAPGVLLAQAIGRWGNYFNQELFGEATDLPWGLAIPATNPAFPDGFPSGTLFHPTFLYEFLLNILGVVLLLALDRRFNLRWGKMFASYLVVYSVIRFFVESIRLDPSGVFFGLRTNQWSAVAGIAIGLLLLYVQNRRHPGLEPSVNIAPKSNNEVTMKVKAK